MNFEALRELSKNRVSRLAMVSALAAGYGILLNPQSVRADELGKQIAQAGTVRSLDKNITGAEAVRLPFEAPSPIITSAPEQASQVDVNKLIPTAFVEIGDSR